MTEDHTPSAKMLKSSALLHEAQRELAQRSSYRSTLTTEPYHEQFPPDACYSTVTEIDSYKRGLAAAIDTAPENSKELCQALLGYLDRRQQEASSPVHRMNLFDLIELLCNWAATAKCDGLDLRDIVREECDRLFVSPQLRAVLSNTAVWLFQTHVYDDGDDNDDED